MENALNYVKSIIRIKGNICSSLLLVFLWFLPYNLVSDIIFTDLKPDVKIEDWNVYSINFFAHPDSIKYGGDGNFDIWKHPSEVVINLWKDAQVLVGQGNLPLALNQDEQIDGNRTSWVQASYASLNTGGTTGNWINKKDKYLGLRVMKNGKWNYGWARLEIDAAPSYFILKDYAYESTSDKGILAGATSSTDVENPDTKDSFHFSLVDNSILVINNSNNYGIIPVNIYNIYGKLVFSDRLETGKNIIDISSLSIGCYIIAVNSSNDIETYKLLKK